MVITATMPAGSDATASVFGAVLVGLGALVPLVLISLYVLPTITKAIAKTQEFLLLFSLGWCLALATLSHYFNFSIEIGALVAGVTLSMSPYRYEISYDLLPRLKSGVSYAASVC